MTLGWGQKLQNPPEVEIWYVQGSTGLKWLPLQPLIGKARLSTVPSKKNNFNYKLAQNIMHTSNVTIRSPSPPDTLADDLSKVSGSVSLPRRVSNTCSISREGRRVGGRVGSQFLPQLLHCICTRKRAALSLNLDWLIVLCKISFEGTSLERSSLLVSKKNLTSRGWDKHHLVPAMCCGVPLQ